MDLEELRARYEKEARYTNRWLAFLLLVCMIGLTLAFYEIYQEEQKYVRSRWKTPCRPVTSPATALPLPG